MVFALFGEKLHRAGKARARFQRGFQRGVRERRVDYIALAAEFLRRVGVRVGDHDVPVQHGHAAVHKRIGRQAGFQRADAGRQVAETFLHRFKAGERAEQREMRRPDVRGDKDRVGAHVQRRRQQIAGRQAEDRTAVRADVADLFQFERQPFRRVQRGQQYDVVHFAHAAVLLVNAADFARDDEPRRRAEIAVLYDVQAVLGGLQRFFQFVPPGRVREIPRPHKAETLAPRP